ncbi:hypothetical protein J4E80_007179 [Alternaria sp. BMP 0032]|nr:hypothetical protein J4E80_007179 [Alternaria sp. BMP 0032]
MDLLFRQIWALMRKTLLLVCSRRPITTFIRALAIPLVVILVIAFSKTWFASGGHWGVSSARQLPSLEEGLRASPGHGIVGFVDNGMKGGEVSAVIDTLSRRISAAGKTPELYDDTRSLAVVCRTDNEGNSPCYSAIVFFSSPTEGTNESSAGYWNYTIQGLTTPYGPMDITSTSNAIEVATSPLQRALELEIIERSQSDNTSQIPSELNVIAFTRQDQGALEADRTASYLNLVTWAFPPIFTLTLIGVVDHLTSFVAREREIGMSSLIDTMIMGGSKFRGIAVRQIAAYASFALVYFPGWLAVAIVISAAILPVTSNYLPVGFVLLYGLAVTGFSLFGASFFKKAQLSGPIMVVVTLVAAILPAVLFNQTSTVCAILSVLFPSANLTYFITGMATFEAADKPVSMMHRADEASESEHWRFPLYIHWLILVLHVFVFPILALLVEHLLFSTASPHRRFERPASAGDPTVRVSDFCKTYKPGFFARLFRRRKNVDAVKGVDFNAYPGQIFCLLGPNGSGKSTTLNCITGEQRVTSGNIIIDPTGGLGYAPQSNVIWPELTVQEHIRIFSDLKCLSATNHKVVNDLAKGVDLLKKLSAKAKTLSGGQKRKLQMAMMFAGGSAVCCVDEVSTGLDPISRRRIWEILLTERRNRTIIMTTHFLDEVDYLADDIAIMYQGTLRAAGTSASLKHGFGDGYTVKLPYKTDVDISISGQLQTEQSRHMTTYHVTTAAHAAEVAAELDNHNLGGYQLSGPTMEELFIKITGDSIQPMEEKTEQDDSVKAKTENIIVDATELDYELSEGQPVSLSKQWWILVLKRVKVLKRRWLPYFVAVAFALVGAGIAPLLIKKFNAPLGCPVQAELVDDNAYRNDIGVFYAESNAYYSGTDELRKSYVAGPSDRLNSTRISLMTDVYSTNHTLSYSDTYQSGYTNSSQLENQLLIVDTYEEFARAVQNDWKELVAHPRYISDGGFPTTELRGGIWMGDSSTNPTIMGDISGGAAMQQMLNFYNVMAGGVGISSSYNEFASTVIPSLMASDATMFIIYYGLIMACYPVFFVLYPTDERLSNVRSMQYSNGIRPVPLWLSHLAFDGTFVVIISAVATGLLSMSTPVWHGLGLVFVIFLLYGIACALLSYVFSMFTKKPVTAWFLMALVQVIVYFAYFAGVMEIQATTPYTKLESMMSALYFGLAIISPVVSLERTLFIGLQQLGLKCNGHSDGSLYLYGGPILFLVVQIALLFALLIWWDSGFVLPSLRRESLVSDTEATDMYTADLLTERRRLASPDIDLRVESVTRSFGKNLAVDDVTFGVKTSEIFALLGPNGAGKSTIISMIRGDIKPSTPGSVIDIAGNPILTSPLAARSSLGVCPQFDSADVLTVRETLRFFAKIRGVKDVEHNVSTVIAACGLSDWTDQLAQKLSGGTKRKLSLAVALVGNPRVLVLDEPSSALDANAKRVMWRCLQTIAKRRAVVLTTHSMEEADALADRIGIVSSRMLALGDREDLKQRAGSEYHIHLVSRSAPCTTPRELQKMKEWIAVTFPLANVSRETQGGQVRFEIPADGNEFAGLIRTLEGAKYDLDVEFYSVGKATLDEVFEKIVKRYGDVAET